MEKCCEKCIIYNSPSQDVVIHERQELEFIMQGNIAQARTQLLTEILEELPKYKQHGYNGADPISKRIYDCDVNAYNQALQEITSLLQTKLQNNGK